MCWAQPIRAFGRSVILSMLAIAEKRESYYHLFSLLCTFSLLCVCFLRNKWIRVESKITLLWKFHQQRYSKCCASVCVSTLMLCPFLCYFHKRCVPPNLRKMHLYKYFTTSSGCILLIIDSNHLFAICMYSSIKTSPRLVVKRYLSVMKFLN